MYFMTVFSLVQSSKRMEYPTFKKWASQLSPSPPCIPPTPQKSLQPRETRAAANPKSHPSSAHRAAFKGLSLALPGRIEPAPCRHLLKLNCCTALDGIRRGDPNEKLRHQQALMTRQTLGRRNHPVSSLQAVPPRCPPPSHPAHAPRARA